MHITVEVMVADVLKVAGNRVLANPLKVISRHRACLVAEGVFMIKHDLIAFARGDDPPVADWC